MTADTVPAVAPAYGRLVRRFEEALMLSGDMARYQIADRIRDAELDRRARGAKRDRQADGPARRRGTLGTALASIVLRARHA